MNPFRIDRAYYGGIGVSNRNTVFVAVDLVIVRFKAYVELLPDYFA